MTKHRITTATIWFDNNTLNYYAESNKVKQVKYNEIDQVSLFESVIHIVHGCYVIVYKAEEMELRIIATKLRLNGVDV